MDEHGSGITKHEPQQRPSATNGFERAGGVLAILAGGWLWEFAVTAICHGYWLDASASCCAGPFWVLAILWAGWPCRIALMLSGFVTFALVALAYVRVDLTSDAQAGIALAMLLVPIPFLSALAYGVGIAIDRRRKRMPRSPRS